MNEKERRAEAIKDRMRELDVTQKALAESAGMTKSQLTYYLNSNAKNSTFERIEKALDEFAVREKENCSEQIAAIREKMLELDVRQGALAKYMNISQPRLCQWMTSRATAKKLSRIESALKRIEAETGDTCEKEKTALAVYERRARAIKQRLRVQKVTQAYLAEHMGLNADYINQQLNGRISEGVLTRIEKAVCEIEADRQNREAAMAEAKRETARINLERAKALKKRLRRLGLTYPALAGYMGLSEGTVANMLNSKVNKNSLDKLEYIACIVEQTGEVPSRPQKWVKDKIAAALKEFNAEAAEPTLESPCAGCIWKNDAGKGKWVCLFPSCVMATEKESVRNDALSKYFNK